MKSKQELQAEIDSLREALKAVKIAENSTPAISVDGNLVKITGPFRPKAFTKATALLLFSPEFAAQVVTAAQ